MKKYLNILLVFVMVFALTGCGKKEEVKSKTPNEVLADVLKNDNSLKEAKVDLAAQIKMNYGGMSIDGNFTVGVSVVNQDGTIKGLIELGENPIVGKGTFYLDNKSVYYSSKLLDTMYGIETENNDWIIANIDDETDSSINEDFSNLDLKNIDVNKIFTDKDFYLISRNGDIGTYRLVISKDLLVRIDKSYDQNSTETYDDFTSNVNIDINIDEKSNRIIKISVDLMDALKDVDFGEDADLKGSVEKMNFDVTISYDNVVVDIPAEVKENAIVADDYISKVQDLLVGE